MDQPAKDRLKKIEEKQEDFDKRLKEVEQNTEPIKTPPYFQYQLSNLQENVTIIKVELKEARADISQLKESQADLRDKLKEQSEDIKYIIKEQEAHKEVIDKIMSFGEETQSTQADHTQRLDRIEVAMATKDDIKRIEATQEQILKLLQERNN